jgi:LysR family transcriptional regulator, regulator for genes of the gallate degradation pathway
MDRASHSHTPHIEPSLRRLRACLAVHECGGVQSAARKLHLSQSSVTRAVQDLERQAGVPLFERTSQGMMATAFGVLLVERASRGLAHLQAAEKEIGRRFSGKVTHRQLAALVAIADHSTETAAAQSLSVSQPAVTMALRDLERLLGQPLFLRTSRGMVATEAGAVLVRRAKLAFSEIAVAGSEITARLGTIAGRVALGVLPLSGALLTARAINLLLAEHPAVQVTVVDGTYEALLQALLCGDLDVIVGGLSYPAPREVLQERLFTDRLSVVARKGHPLAGRRALKLADLSGREWIIPRRGTPARARFDALMREAGIVPAGSPVESNVLSAVRALLAESDRLAVISRQQIWFEERSGLLAVLPVDVESTAVHIGVRTRAGAALSVPVQALLTHLRGIATQSRNYGSEPK